MHACMHACTHNTTQHNKTQPVTKKTPTFYNSKKIKILLDTARDMVKARAGGECKARRLREKRKHAGTAGRASTVRVARCNVSCPVFIAAEPLHIAQCIPSLLNLEIDSAPTVHWQEVVSQGNQGVDLNSHWNRLRLIFESLLCYFDVCLIEQLQTPRTKVIRRPRTG